MEAESYADNNVAKFIHDNFIPVEAHIKEHPVWFHRFEANWTPAILVLDADGRERYRIEGYLPTNEFVAQLKLGLARVPFMHKKWTHAQRWYDEIVQQHAGTGAAPEALYWSGVMRYKSTNDHTYLGNVAALLEEKYKGSIWTGKASIWLPEPSSSAA